MKSSIERFKNDSYEQMMACKVITEIMEVVIKAKEKLPDMDLKIAGFRIIKEEEAFIVLSPDDVFDDDDDIFDDDDDDDDDDE